MDNKKYLHFANNTGLKLKIQVLKFMIAKDFGWGQIIQHGPNLALFSVEFYLGEREIQKEKEKLPEKLGD